MGTNASKSSVSSATSSSTTMSSSAIPNNRFADTTNEQNIVKNHVNGLTKRTITTIKTTNVGNGFSKTLSAIKSKSISMLQQPKQDDNVPTTSPIFKRTSRITKTSPTQTIEESVLLKTNQTKVTTTSSRTSTPVVARKYTSNILESENNANRKSEEERTLNGLKKTPIKSVKLLNNLNMFQTKAFAVPVKSEDDA